MYVEKGYKLRSMCISFIITFHAIYLGQNGKVHVLQHCSTVCQTAHHFICCCTSQETQRLIQEPVPGITATADEQNARYFKVQVAGPKDVSF